MAQDKQARVFIVDDHPIVRDGLVRLINREDDLTVCGEAGDAPSALKGIKKTNPDIAVVDMSLEGGSGLQLIKDITTEHKKVAVLVLSMHDERLYAARALRAGAKGYIMKQEASTKVLQAIRRVLAGEIHVSEELAARMMHEFVGSGPVRPASPEAALTDRELEVFQLIGQGFKTHEIGAKLHLSSKTIETYREHIKTKLNLANSSELTQYAIEWVHGDHAK